MITLIRLSPTRWPYSVAQLRADEPQLSLSPDPHDGELAALAELGILVARVQPTPSPADTREQRAEEAQPVQDEAGIWRQAWAMRPATDDELTAWDAAHAPAPDWSTFKSTALGSTSLNTILTSAYQSAPVAAGALAPALLRAEQGDVTDFAAAWSAICAAVTVPAEVITDFMSAATACSLPTSFIASLDPVTQEL